MAFYDPDEEEQQDPNQQNAGVQTGPSSSVISGGVANSSSPQAAGTPDKGGNFVGLQTYLDANKPQATKLGDQTAGIVSNSVAEARDGVSGLNSKFNSQVDANTVAQDEAATSLVGSSPESLSEAQRNQIKKQYGASYNGPNALSDLGDDYTSALQKTNVATQNLNDASSESGRGNLISQINSKPRTTGMTSFDSMLLQKGPGRDKLLSVADQNKDVKDLVGNAQTVAQQKVGTVDDPNTPNVNEATGAKGTTATTQNNTYKAVQDALSAWKTGFEPKLTAAQDTGLQTRVTGDLTDYKLDGETMQMLGVAPDEIMYNNKLSEYMNPFSPQDNSAANVASASDYARYGALADLAGIQDPYLKQADIDKAGTAKQFSLNKDKLRADLDNSKAAYEKDYGEKTGFADNYIRPAFGGAKDAWFSDLLGQSMNDIENYWLKGGLAQRNYDGNVQSALQQALNAFKNQYGLSNKIESNVPVGNVTTMPVRRGT